MKNSTSESVGLKLRLPVMSSFLISWSSALTGDEAEKCTESPIARDSSTGVFRSDQMNMHRDTNRLARTPESQDGCNMKLALITCGYNTKIGAFAHTYISYSFFLKKAIKRIDRSREIPFRPNPKSRDWQSPGSRTDQRSRPKRVVEVVSVDDSQMAGDQV